MSQANLALDERQIELSRSHEKASKMDEKFDNSNIGVSALTGTVESIDTNGPEARKVLRKIDCHLLPILAVTYFIQFLDKSCVSYAALWGMREDAHLEGSQYSWLTTMFYIGYLVSEFPINVLFQKFDIARTCGIFIILWGIVLLCMTAAHDFAGLATARFFLGALEAGVSPCFVLLTAMFYKRSEQPFRTSLWFSMNGMANILGGLLGYAIGFIDADIPTWKFPFVIFGSLTIVWGVIFLFITPSNPTTAKWLTQEEKVIAVMRLAENETGIDNKQWKWHQVKEAVMDPRFWLLNLLALANNIPNGGVSAFGPLIVNGFGYSQFQSTLLNMPSGAAQIMALWTSGFLATRLKGARHFLMLGGICVAIVGASLIYAMPDNRKVPRLLGYYLLVGFSVVWVLALTFVQANVAGRTKKTIFASSVFVSYCLGNIIGPQLFFSYEAPRYQSGFAAMIVCFCVQILLVTAMYFVNWRENTRRDRLATGDNDVDRDVDVALGLSDLTDKENLHFRYVL